MATLSIQIPDKLDAEIEMVCADSSKAKSYIINKAISEYVEDYQDYLEALERFKEKDKTSVSLDDMKARFGI